MRMVWQKKLLGEVSQIYSGFAFRSQDLGIKGIPVLKIANIQNKLIVPQCADHFPEELLTDRLKRYFLHSDDTLVAMTGAGSVGKVGKMPAVEGKYLVNQRVGIVRPDRSMCDPSFIYYCLSQDFYETKLYALGLGAGQPNVSGKQIAELEILSPPIPVQQRIAGILSAYDELIENSQRRIKILEAMARGLYREWFVHFRFPGHGNHPRVASVLGEIPQGWEVKKLGDIAENFDRMRKPLSKMERSQLQGEYPYYGAAKVFDYVNDYIFDGEYLLFAEDGSVITPERAPVLQLVKEKFWPNNHTHVLRGLPPFSTHFLYLGLSEVDISPYITGAAQPKITQENMNRIPFFCGPARLHLEFNRLVEPMIRQSHILQRQIQNLRRTRDLLLPRLLSSQIALDELEAA